MSSGLNKEWISSDKIDTTPYQSGLLDFFKFLIGKDGVEKASANRKKFYSCPCRTCCNKKGKVQCDEIISHLLQFGMDKSYTTWYYHGEEVVANLTTDAPIHVLPIDNIAEDDWDENSFETSNPTTNDVCHEGNSGSVPDLPVGFGKNKESKYARLKRLAQGPLYPSSQHSTMDALLKVNDLKNEHNLSSGATDGVLRILKELLPMENSIGSTYHEMKCTLKEAELSCTSYDVCINNCMLFWKEHANSTHCTKCQEPRYKSLRETTIRQNNKSTRGTKRKRTAVHMPRLKQVARKVMKYFPVIPRLKRLYGIKWIAKAMTWHADAKCNVDFLRHPCDSAEWRNANRNWKHILDSRSVRLALAIDGFKPYGQFGASYSCWPVILQPLNLPPSLTMNSEFSMLTVLVPGKNAPKGAEIDVFLQPLIEDLLVLWKGVDHVWDAHEMSPFTLKAMLLWCIHDFPAYGLLAGCSHSGHEACPICSKDTPSLYLHFSRKCSYLRSRIFLSKDHPFRYDTSTETFNGEEEHGVSSPRLEGKHIEHITSKIGNIGGTSTETVDDYEENGDDVGPVNTKGFSRRSGLFDLPYWSTNSIRHNLDLMHIEKNVTEIILNTILSLKGTKDTWGAREDLEHLGLKRSLWLRLGKDGETKVPPEAPFVLSNDEKSRFFNTLKTTVVPTRLSSNFNISVNAEHKTLSFISHDYHVVMEHLLPALLMDAYPTTEKLLLLAFQRISIFFNVLCAKIVSREHLIKAKLALTEAVCILEAYFPPAFFVSMIHLMHHLGDEALTAGPVRFRSMWSFERQILKYKGWARNKRYIEGSISEAYLLYEASLYAMEFKGTRKRNREAFFDYEDPDNWGQHVGAVEKTVLSTTQMVQARRWVLHQQPDYEDWRRKYDETGRQTIESTWKYEVDDFLMWLKDEAKNKGDSQLQRVCQGPDFNVDSYNQFNCNGYTFSTVGYDANKLVQNSGVSMKAYNSNGVMTTYYGVIRGIFDLDYGDHTITVFYCDWVDSDDRAAFKVHPTSKLVMVNLSRTIPLDNINAEPFILASQARQVFYCNASKEHGWSVVIPVGNMTEMSGKRFQHQHQQRERHSKVSTARRKEFTARGCSFGSGTASMTGTARAASRVLL